MRIRYNILNISLFIVLHSYDFIIPWDIEGDVSKRETPIIRKRVKEILIIRK